MYLIYFFRRFIVLSFTFRSLVHFELIFVFVMRSEFNFILLHVDIYLSQLLLLKRLFFPSWFVLTSFSEMLTINILVFISVFSSSSIDLHVFISVPHCLYYCCFVVTFEIGNCESFNLFFFKMFLANLGFLSVQIYFRIGLSISAKPAAILTEIALTP